MTSITFDTLKFVETLTESGFDEKQAKALSTAQKMVFEQVMDTSLATKVDVLAIRNDISTLRSDIQEDIHRLGRRMDVIAGELKLTKWMLALVVAATVLPILKTVIK